MFKDSVKSKLDISHFGAGSIVQPDGPNGPHCLLVAIDDTLITYLNLEDFLLSNTRMKVSDANHLTSSEARGLVNLIFVDYGFNSTFSDAELLCKGLKK